MRRNVPTNPEGGSLTLSIKPTVKIIERKPARIRLELNVAATLLTPKSLRAFILQLNQGDCTIARDNNERAITGLIIPQNPAARSHIPH